MNNFGVQLDEQHQKLIEGKCYKARAGYEHREKQGKEKREGGCASLSETSHKLCLFMLSDSS